MKKLILAALLISLYASVANAQTQWVADITVEYDAAFLADRYDVIVRGSSSESVTDVGSNLSPKIVGVPAGDLYTLSVRSVNQWGMSDELVLGQADLRKPGKPNNGRIVNIEGRKQ